MKEVEEPRIDCQSLARMKRVLQKALAVASEQREVAKATSKTQIPAQAEYYSSHPPPKTPIFEFHVNRLTDAIKIFLLVITPYGSGIFYI